MENKNVNYINFRYKFIDSHWIYALKMLRNSKGEHIGAIKSVVKQLDKLIKENNPICIISDSRC